MAKVAFCFLTYGNVSQPSLWAQFFTNKQDKHNIYIHPKEPFTDPTYHFEKYCINHCVSTRYAHISVVKATIELFKKALLDPENQYVVLLSESCIPLYNFDHVYTRIIETNSNIISRGYNNNMERCNDLTDGGFFDKNHFAKQNPCMILNRQTADFFIHNDFTYLFNDQFYAPDEHYFVNACHKFNIQYVNAPINYAHWEWNHQGRPKTYHELTIEEIINIRNQGFLFMRKIGKECRVPYIF
jgi:hypothetical protein